jgi:hypothetical protein
VVTKKSLSMLLSHILASSLTGIIPGYGENVNGTFVIV